MGIWASIIETYELWQLMRSRVTVKEVQSLREDIMQSMIHQRKLLGLRKFIHRQHVYRHNLERLEVADMGLEWLLHPDNPEGIRTKN